MWKFILLFSRNLIICLYALIEYVINFKPDDELLVLNPSGSVKGLIFLQKSKKSISSFMYIGGILG